MLTDNPNNRRKKKVLSVFGLVMINVIAVDSLRTLPMSAAYGFSAAFYYLVAALVFFIPMALVAAELSTGWPKTGGIYIWVREAFGERIGFVVIWLQWFYNICWYPTIMSLIAATLAYCINPHLVNNVFYMLTVVIAVFWGATIVNCFGMRASGVMSNIAALIGTIVPMLFVALLGIIWVMMGKPIQIDFSWSSFLPNLSRPENLVLLTAVLFGLVGMEMSAIHAQDVENPQKDYPKALLFSTIIILCTLILGSLAIAAVVPLKKLSLVAGLLQAFALFFAQFHMSWMMPVIALLIICGAIGGVGAWILGPAKCLLVASQDGSLPPLFKSLSRRNVPVIILITQGIIFTLLCSVFLLMPSVNSSFWVLTDVSAQLSLIVYVAMFSSALVLRYKQPDVPRAFKIPFGNVGIWVVTLLGLTSSLFAIGIGFLPPAQVKMGSLWRYEGILLAGIMVGCLVPFVIYSLRRPEWKNSI